MISTALMRRLQKAERRLRPAQGVVFVAWGVSDEHVEAGLRQAAAAGTIAVGDLVVRVAWPFVEPCPESRWAVGQVGEFPWAEFGCLALLAEVYRRALQRAIDERGEMGDIVTPVEISAKAFMDVLDAHLIARALGSPYGSAPALPTSPDAMRRLVGMIAAIDLRASVRGCFEVLDRLTLNDPPPAARIAA